MHIHKKIALAASAMLVLAATTAVSPAQEPQMFQVYLDHIDVGQTGHYEAAVPGMWGAARKGGFSAPINVSTSLSSPGTYIYVVPVDDWGHLGKLNDKWAQVVTSSPDAFSELNAASLGRDIVIYTTRPDLSYTPEKPRLPADQALFAQMIWLYPHPGQGAALETLIKGANALNAKIANPNGVLVVQMVAGPDGPKYGVQLRGKDQADFHTESARIEALRDNEWQSLMNKMTPLLRKIEIATSMGRPDLSYSP